MRIAFDYQTFILQSYGGISRYITRVAQGLHGMGQEVKIFAPLHRNNYIRSLPKEIIHGCYIKSYPPKTTRILFKYNQIAARMMVARWKPDVTHETYYSRKASAPRSCPSLITVHDMIHELFPDEFAIYDNTAELKRKAVARADHIICVSENTKQDLMRLYGTPACKLSVVHHGFDYFDYQSCKEPAAAYRGKPFILYVGQRAGYKNFVSFLKAVASSNRLRTDYDIVAFGGGRISSAEQKLISILGFNEEQVKYVTGNDDLLGVYYSLARALVYPSLYEGFGIPPLEAMAHRCPVISSNTSSMPEVIGSACEYFDPVDIEDMRRAIEDVVYSDSRIESLMAAGAERIKEFSWNKCSKETLDIYRMLV
jgi:glycosyltransferase involved in cell wall biosynthesis